MSSLASLIQRHFIHKPTPDQQSLIGNLERFLADDSNRPAFLLKGYAGTGKTSMISALVRSLPALGFKHLLLSPTGRAAKVMTSYSGRAAFTIHKIIYKIDNLESSDGFNTRIQKNYNRNTIFIVDEASMITDEGEFGGGKLLSDLIRFIYMEDSENRLILIGDLAQLPPVGQQLSVALDPVYLRHRFQLNVYESEIRQVVRQEKLSGILHNATRLREDLFMEKDWKIKFRTKGFPDVYRMTGEKLEDGLRYAYQKYGVDNTILICRSNKSAVQYNRYIRNNIFFYENELEAGDRLMIVKNNYFFAPDGTPAGFLANGDLVEVRKVRNFNEIYGLRFADLELKFPEPVEQAAFEAKVILDVLHNDSPALPPDRNRELYKQVLEDYQDLAKESEKKKALRSDQHLNALQVKFAYALTCHKSQGGQWEAVFVDQGYLKDGKIDKEFLRWLYTAITRATKELFLVNFTGTFFEN